jgi:glycosyltransferase involved in cell wall biosynthesis
MAMKKPVVSTSVGAEGLKVEHGENILIADNPGDFSSKVSKLLLDKDMAKSIGEAGWKLVRLQYDWKVLAEKQNQVWENLGMSKLGR